MLESKVYKGKTDNGNVYYEIWDTELNTWVHISLKTINTLISYIERGGMKTNDKEIRK